jgi:septal ring factor EnvC (AmiA/AmiB activator)
MVKTLITSALFLCVIVLPVMAQPTPPTHPIQNLDARMEAEKKKERTLKKEMKAIDTDLQSKKKDIVNIARKVKKNEQNLIDLERRIDAQKDEQLKIEARLNKDKGAISDLILGLDRMRRIPPEALIARPGAPLETAQSAMLLQSLLPNIYKRADGLKADLTRLNTLITNLETHRIEALKSAQNLKKNQTQLTSLMNARKMAYMRASKGVKKQQAALKKIARESVTLKELMAKLEKKQWAENKRQAAMAKKAKQRAKNAQKAAKKNATVQQASVTTKTFKATPIPRAGTAQLPISGHIKVSYGARDDIGAVSKGLTIAGRKGAIVVAPMGGVIDYAGPFRGYGNIIILKHQKKYHSLIAGLDKIDIVVGRSVSAGEPLGYMNKNTSSDTKPSLYYELRYNGHPVNPSKKISGLR